MLKGFKDFIMRGDVVALAVGIVIGGAFATVVNSIVDGIINPVVALVLGNNTDGLSGIGFDIGDQYLNFGTVIDALITFTATAAAIYFLVVVPINKLMEARRKGEDDSEPTPEERMVELLEQIAAKQ